MVMSLDFRTVRLRREHDKCTTYVGSIVEMFVQVNERSTSIVLDLLNEKVRSIRVTRSNTSQSAYISHLDQTKTKYTEEKERHVCIVMYR
jgi:hypothetical protein